MCSEEDDEAERALKVVLTEANVEELHKEYDNIKAYSNTQHYGALPVVSHCANAKDANVCRVAPLMAAGYLMSTVGVPAMPLGRHWRKSRPSSSLFVSFTRNRLSMETQDAKM